MFIWCIIMSRFKGISPHLTIYKFPVTAISSITNRVTGVALSGAFVGSGVYALSGRDPLKTWESLDPKIQRAGEVGVTFPIVYHTAGGIRHLLWDRFPTLLTTASTRTSSIGLILGSVVATGLTDYYRHLKTTQ